MTNRHFYQGEEITRAQARELVITGQAVIQHASPFGVPWRLGGGPGPWLEYEAPRLTLRAVGAPGFSRRPKH
jgi:hypothetical protein